MANHPADTHFDTIVVGSGFGGSVTAYRFAKEGQRVLVLERGKAYPPGSFARRPREMKDNFWDPSRGQHGVFNVWSFRGIEALVASGLGGGSLIYANVLLRKDERWFVKDAPFGGGYEHWPINRADLEPHYDAVERMLTPTPFPLTAPGYGIPKTLATQEAAAALGLDWRLPPLAVTFSPDAGSPPTPGVPIAPGPYPNLHARPRLTCRLCGECNIGCNEGSKNTLDHTYLSAAAHHGAEIRTRSEVRHLAPLRNGGYQVDYVEHSPEREGKATDTGKLPLRTVTADRLVLAAGALGTPYLLLRNRAALPNLSPAIGTRFCGNGDLLSLVLKSRLPPPLRQARVMDSSLGPVITSAIRVPDAVDGDGGEGRGYYVEDAGYPVLVDWLAQGADVPGSINRLLRFALRRVWAVVTRSPVSDLGSEVGGLLGRAELSSTSLTLLGMGRDVPDGIMRLRKGWLDVDWTVATSKDYFERVRSTMRAISDHLDGRFADNPLWLLKKVVTVHPLGGAPMGRHPGEGVVDAYGEVFGHPGLYVADGAAMPGPVGANPSLTIAAFADRLAERALASRSRPTPSQGASVTDQQNNAAPCSLRFTEEMKGYITLGEDDYHVGFREGRKSGAFLMFHLTITLDDVDAFVADPAHEASAAGWVQCEQLGGQLPVQRGIFNLFVEGDDASRTTMLYRLFFADGSGQPLTLSGFKDVKDDPGFDVWQDTSTLYVKVLRGHVEAEGEKEAEADGGLLAAGILNIYLLDFLQQLTTFRVEGPSMKERASAFGAFGRLFLGKLWDLYRGRAEAAAEVE